MQLLQHFKELTIYPKNAHELKDLILQLAVQGNLTSKWREENRDIENANQIYKRIIKEREALINKRKIKLRDIKPIQETMDMRYKLPETWQWFRFSDVVFYQEGPGIRKWQFRDLGVKLLNVQNIVGDTLVLENTEKHVEKDEFDKKYQHFKVEDGDLLFASSGGSWGKSAWFKDPGYEVMMNTSMIRLRFYSLEWFPEYLKYFLSSIFFKKQLECQLVGIQPNFGSTHLGRSFIPIPPIEEQKEIVRVVETLFKEVEQLEQLTIERIILKEKFIASALQQLTTNNAKKEWVFLQDHFKKFFNETNNIKKLRETVLQLAVKGKLTTDWRLSYPELVSGFHHASELLKRIKKEKTQLIKDKKIKKEKPLSPITKDEFPYELPRGWVWCRFGDLITFLNGYAFKSSTYVPVSEYQIIRLGNVKNDNFLINTKEAHIPEVIGQQTLDYQLFENDILTTLTGTKDRRDYCFTCLVKEEDLKDKILLLNQRVGCIRAIDKSASELLNKFLKSHDILNQLFETETGTANQGNIGSTAFKNLAFPLPPLEEQKAIVQKVNALMGLCDELEQQIDNSQTQIEQLMQSCLEEVFTDK